MIRRILKFSLFTGAFCIIAGVSAYLTLHFFVGSRSGTVVPDLSGEHVVAALELLTDLSLNTKIKGMEYSADVPIHHVISQHPAPGAEIKPGRDVRITLSKGPETIRMPAITGLGLNQSRIVLEENGLSLGNISRVYDDRTTTDEVLSQVPGSGRIIHRDQPVNLLVSLGRRPAAFIMPDLTGLSIHDAMKRIETLRLTLGGLTSVSIPDRPLDKIIEQTPLPGHRISEDESVTLTINRKKTSNGTFPEIRERLLLIRYATPPGFLNQHVRLRLNCYNLSIDVLDDFIRPGNDLWFFVPGETNASAFLYVDGELITSEVIE